MLIIFLLLLKSINYAWRVGSPVFKVKSIPHTVLILRK
jgi:hypothetical protein